MYCEGKGGIKATVVAHSINRINLKEIYTLQLIYPRFIHSEFMTHRMFSRNASSSRAIPVDKMLSQVTKNPAMPIHWGVNKPGMQASEELQNTAYVKADWLCAAGAAIGCASSLKDYGAHKQVTNRLLEPFQFMNVVVTATEWDNFFKLRLHPDAQPEIQELSRCMYEAMDRSEPQTLPEGYWHAPYIKGGMCDDENFLLASVARCARVSYKNHDHTNPVFRKDVELAKHLLSCGHMSPFEHQAKTLEIEFPWESGVTHCDNTGHLWSGNFQGFIQYRQILCT